MMSHFRRSRNKRLRNNFRVGFASRKDKVCRNSFRCPKMEVHCTFELQVENINGQALMAVDVKGQQNCSLIIHERSSGLNFLVDIVDDISVVPSSSAERCKPKYLINLLSANGTKIDIYRN
ncbi:hypothetical protein AVEN_20273-1 [Araneus ventricosus]|uniref:Uncharacterized protein n=1 Tax=Araneus ventricosus TaxID=182803 RepID=A0A4Y2JLX9_ARAVE|nr:hypothetical protein AVEN_20273-1 [Araneus ventricosus]